jgi:hypothetical protein
MRTFGSELPSNLHGYLRNSTPIRNRCSDNVLKLAHSAVTTAHAINICKQNSERDAGRRMVSAVGT